VFFCWPFLSGPLLETRYNIVLCLCSKCELRYVVDSVNRKPADFYPSVQTPCVVVEPRRRPGMTQFSFHNSSTCGPYRRLPSLGYISDDWLKQWEQNECYKRSPCVYSGLRSTFVGLNRVDCRLYIKYLSRKTFLLYIRIILHS
jgi:hypothetical protein